MIKAGWSRDAGRPARSRYGHTWPPSPADSGPMGRSDAYRQKRGGEQPGRSPQDVMRRRRRHAKDPPLRGCLGLRFTHVTGWSALQSVRVTGLSRLSCRCAGGVSYDLGDFVGDPAVDQVPQSHALSMPTLWLSRSTQFSPPRTPRSGSATTAPWTRPAASSTDSSHHQADPASREKDGGRAVGHATRQGHSLAMRAHAAWRAQTGGQPGLIPDAS